MNEYLYHYTSIETLALILKNRNIRFNNLLYVDDPEEAETRDLGLSGKYCLVSCWTKSSEDTLPMWCMYTPRMNGVRIKMRINPFVRYTYNKGEFHFTDNISSCIDYRGDYTKSVTITPNCPELIKINYTNDEDLLHPLILSLTKDGVDVSLEKLGRHKRKYWILQKEYRYIITTAPWTMDELERAGTEEKQIRLFNRLLDRNNKQICKELYLNLAEDAFDDMEILLAPKTSEADYIIVEALLAKYCPDIHINVEKSKMRVR